MDFLLGLFQLAWWVLLIVITFVVGLIGQGILNIYMMIMFKTKNEKELTEEQRLALKPFKEVLKTISIIVILVLCFAVMLYSCKAVQ